MQTIKADELDGDVLRSVIEEYDEGNGNEGVPTVFERHFECDCGATWTDWWGCDCNDRCPQCDDETESHEATEYEVVGIEGFAAHEAALVSAAEDEVEVGDYVLLYDLPGAPNPEGYWGDFHEPDGPDAEKAVEAIQQCGATNLRWARIERGHPIKPPESE